LLDIAESALLLLKVKKYNKPDFLTQVWIKPCALFDRHICKGDFIIPVIEFKVLNETDTLSIGILKNIFMQPSKTTNKHGNV
jgi:hypothetical protein